MSENNKSYKRAALMLIAGPVIVVAAVLLRVLAPVPQGAGSVLLGLVLAGLLLTAAGAVQLLYARAEREKNNQLSGKAKWEPLGAQMGDVYALLDSCFVAAVIFQHGGKTYEISAQSRTDCRTGLPYDKKLGFLGRQFATVDELMKTVEQSEPQLADADTHIDVISIDGMDPREFMKEASENES